MDSLTAALPARLDIRDLAFGIHDNWPAGRLAPAGPVDVVDMFSGCGGMSSGFLSVNAVRPSYRLALWRLTLIPWRTRRTRGISVSRRFGLTCRRCQPTHAAWSWLWPRRVADRAPPLF
jgi:hypothetical protein